MQNMKTKHGMVLGAVLGLVTALVASAEPTALDLVNKGDQYVGVQSKDKVIQISSDKSVATLTPNIWHIVYYDPDSTFKTVEVKFGAGQEMEVSHPMRMFPDKPGDILDLSKLRVDSDRALKIAASQPLLKALTLRASKMTLGNTDDGVVWKVELWAAKVGDSTKEADIGSLTISAADRSVVRSDLHPGNAD
jgi:hypothetical protein